MTENNLLYSDHDYFVRRIILVFFNTNYLRIQSTKDTRTKIFPATCFGCIFRGSKKLVTNFKLKIFSLIHFILQ
jgi:hypothetical protein